MTLVSSDAPVEESLWEGGSKRARRLQLLGVFVAALVTRLLTVGHFATTDEPAWLLRTMGFSGAIVDGNLEGATASTGQLATMPGVTTMWLGSLGRLTSAIFDALGISYGDDTFVSMAGLGLAQAMVALATAALVTLIAASTCRWAGWGAAAVVAVLLVGEPWVTGLGSVLHTDELTALFGTAGLLLIAISFDVPHEGGRRRPVLSSAVAGVVLVLAPLTKATGLAFLPGAAAMILYALWRDRGRTIEGEGSLATLRWKQAAAATAGAVVTVPLAWPALLVDPLGQASLFMDSIGIAEGSTSFPGSEASGHWWYYAAALPFRMTPWFFLATLVGIPLAFVHRLTRVRAIWVAVWLLPPAIAISVVSKQFDRYGLVVLVPLALITAIGIGPHLTRAMSRVRALRPAGIAVVTAIVLYGVTVAPWGLLYFNPLLGGADKAERYVLIGWGEGSELAVEQIRELESGDCERVTVGGVRPTVFGANLPVALGFLGLPCANSAAPGQRPTYVVAYVNQMQRMTDKQRQVALAGREQVGRVEIRGIEVATIWR
jgi:hypothetical protein